MPAKYVTIKAAGPWLFMRIGVNAGSLEDLLEKYGEPSPDALVKRLAAKI